MRRIPASATLLLLGLLLTTTACQSNKRYRLQGKVLAKDPAKSELTIVHKEIPGFMPAMTMPYRVKDPAVVEEIQPGSTIAADVVTSGQGKEVWLENVIITEENAHGPAARGETNYLSAGASVPDLKMTNQDGKAIHLSQFRGKALLLTFIYTRCPLPEFCPRLTAQFAALHRELTKSADESQRTHLITVTLDPKYDTPAILRQYGLAYTGDASAFQHWDFVSAAPSDLKKLAEEFGLDYEEDSGQINHTMSTVLISPEGNLLANWEGSQWKPEEVLQPTRNAERR